MRSCFVVTHPSLSYDRALNARDDIIRIAGTFAPVNRYILYENFFATKEACNYYLSNAAGNFVFSSRGNIDYHERSVILNGCDNLTLSGHLFGSCHLSSYESILLGKKDDHMTVRVPLRASCVMASGIPASEFALSIEKPSLGYLRRSCKFVELDMDRAQRSVVVFAADYVDSALSSAPDSDIDFQVDGQTVLRSSRERKKKIVIDFQLAA